MRNNVFIGRGVVVKRVDVPQTETRPLLQKPRYIAPDYRMATAAQAEAYRQSLIAKGIIKVA